MGDRTTPMKFGPEWLRNLSREPTSPGSQTPAGGPQSSLPVRPVSIATSSGNAAPPSKVLLAKLRYGREEILALYDRQTAEAPPQLKSMELLYHPRGKPPYALNNNFEDDTRDSNMRNNPNLGMNPAERYGQGRGRGMSEGRGRGIAITERSRARGFVRQTSLGSDTFRAPTWHNNGGQRTYPATPDDDPVPPRGPWNNGNSINPPGMRPTPEQAEWANKMAYRKNRQNHTNWRQQQNRDEGEEWRSSEGARRGQEKWEREWPERSNQEKPWASSNRRQWGGDNEDALPEWAVENSEACGGTFDSSGAFHGYSNDDSNIPKMPEPTYPLARSHTHGSFARSKTAEEGSDEWWASEKAKKLSTKRFDATDVKFKKPNEQNSDGNSATNTDAETSSGQTRDNSTFESYRNRSTSSEEPTHDLGLDLQDEAAALPAKREEPKEDDKTKDRTYQNYSDGTQQSAQYRIGMLLRSEERDTNNERGNYKSVMMTPSNDHLRQKHQNIGAPTNDVPNRVTHYYDISKIPPRPNRESEEESQQKQQESKLVEDMLDMHLNEEIQAQLLNSTAQTAGMVHPVSSMANKRTSPGLQQVLMNSPLLKQRMGIGQNNANTAPSPGLQQQSMMRTIGITNSMLNASLGLPIDTGSNIAMTLTSMPPPTIQNANRMESRESMGSLASSIQSGIQSSLQSAMQVGGLPSAMQGPGMQGNSFQSGGGMTGNMQGNMQPVGINNSNLQSAAGMPGFQNVGNNSLFMQGAPNTMQNPNNMANHGQQQMYPMHSHNLQHSASQGSFSAAALYGNMMQPPPSAPLTNIPLTEQWYYEDPKKTIQGPFTTKEMYGWYRAGFFNPDLLVRRACESGLRPLENYGLMPFGPMDILIPPPISLMSARFDMRPQTSHENTMLNAQQVGLGPEVESLWNQPSANEMMWIQQSMTLRDDNNRVNNLPRFFWDQPSGMSNSLLPEGIVKEMKTEDEILAQMRASQGDPTAQNLTFISDGLNPEDAFTVGTNIAPNLEELQKLIGSDIHVSSAHRAETAASTPAPVSSALAAAAGALPALQRPNLSATTDKDQQAEKVVKAEPIPEVSAKQQVSTKTTEIKPAKQSVKVEEKPAKKDAVTTKAKNKKLKEEKKDDTTEVLLNEGEKKNSECPTAEDPPHHFGSWFYDNVIKRLQKRSEAASPLENTDEQKRSDEPSPPKNKKDDKPNKKELEKEKKEWLKDGFTIVKGTDKKDNKKKEKEEARAVEEAEKKRKEEEKRALVEAEKNRAPEPVTRRQQLEIGQAQRQQSQTQIEPPKKAPWSAQSSGRDGLALSDIQRLEREKKLEQMKEQQQMMQVIAQQQAAAAQREQQELQAGQMGWAKKKQPNNSPPGQTLAEIQAEARKQAAAIAAAATAAAAREEARVTPPLVNIAPWTATNGGGFWDSPASGNITTKYDSKIAETAAPKVAEPKPKKKVTVVAPSKKEASPSADFETWCTNVLSNWKDAANIDIPTFVAFLRDIESPYEVKDYVKCYLGDTKESNDFSRQFLERRSRLLRVGMVTPSDDLCSPAVAINPRTNSGSDYTEVKSKGNKKTKKNKMLKIDARILGFSVTASEDRINIGDIDTV